MTNHILNICNRFIIHATLYIKALGKRGTFFLLEFALFVVFLFCTLCPSDESIRLKITLKITVCSYIVPLHDYPMLGECLGTENMHNPVLSSFWVCPVNSI